VGGWVLVSFSRRGKERANSGCTRCFPVFLLFSFLQCVLSHISMEVKKKEPKSQHKTQNCRVLFKYFHEEHEKNKRASVAVFFSAAFVFSIQVGDTALPKKTKTTHARVHICALHREHHKALLPPLLTPSHLILKKDGERAYNKNKGQQLFTSGEARNTTKKKKRNNKTQEKK
jgi:hypothetical protein